MLAHDEELLNAVTKMDKVKKAENTITTNEELYQDLSLVRTRGYAIDNLEQNNHLICIGAPIFDQDCKVCAAISATSFYKMTIDMEKESASDHHPLVDCSRYLFLYWLGHRFGPKN